MDDKTSKVLTPAQTDLCEQLKSIRKQAGLTQEQLSEILNISRASVNRIESNNSNAINALPMTVLVAWYEICSNDLALSSRHSFIYSIMRFFKV